MLPVTPISNLGREACPVVSYKRQDAKQGLTEEEESTEEKSLEGGNEEAVDIRGHE